MSRGRKPKPLAMRVLEGGTDRNGAVSNRPMPVRVEVGSLLDSAEPPEELGPAGQLLWRDVISKLVELGVVTTADYPAIVTMCRHWEHMADAQAEIEAEGYWAEGSQGQIRPHPAIRLFNEASALFLRYASEFGLTASARVKLGYVDAARRTLQHDLDEKLGWNPRRTAEP